MDPSTNPDERSPRPNPDDMPSWDADATRPPVATAARGRRSPFASTTAKVVGALFAVSMLFFAFAGGMVFQRFVIGENASASASEAPSTFDQAWELVTSEFVDPDAIDQERMLEAAIDGMLATLGDEGHTRYMTPVEAHAESESLSGEYVGVGIQVEDTDQGITVVAPIDGTPAMRAGVMPGDVLLAVDGRDVTGRSVDDVIGSIRGEEGSKVTLTFRREGEPEPLTFTLTRERIETSSVSWTMLDGNIADIRLSQFSSGAGDDVQQALREAQQEGATGIILDLRNNPGGYINEALQIGSTFVPEGETIFISQFRDGSQEEHTATRQPVTIGDLPLVVLINEGSASSSEIVSGAIKAHNANATVIGETTFGTGTVLSNFGLGDGSAILLGTELWLTPDGEFIREHGVRPDVIVGMPSGQFPFIPVDNAAAPDTIEDFQLQWAREILATE